MKRLFADTFHWIAFANPNDQHHARAVGMSKELWPFRTVTTDEVLLEFLNAMLKSPNLRATASKQVQAVYQDPNIQVLPQTRISFLSGLSLYQDRPDKTYSLTDCISMQSMRDEGIQEVLTNDRHFEQEGFIALYRTQAE
ncbi:MAG: PIN domain-containing protein [Planctomycetes bacterium]|nr:PIN domain-containing protein [Planctomycetota bacterium]MBU4399667.1 PIN domain-containing protein [Planctomycetota bacterium]MCG2685721.1 PIN domain-containing protein [Planctomycetales bacterium]